LIQGPCRIEPDTLPECKTLLPWLHCCGTGCITQGDGGYTHCQLEAPRWCPPLMDAQHESRCEGVPRAGGTGHHLRRNANRGLEYRRLAASDAQRSFRIVNDDRAAGPLIKEHPGLYRQVVWVIAGDAVCQLGQLKLISEEVIQVG